MVMVLMRKILARFVARSAQVDVVRGAIKQGISTANPIWLANKAGHAPSPEV